MKLISLMAVILLLSADVLAGESPSIYLLLATSSSNDEISQTKKYCVKQMGPSQKEQCFIIQDSVEINLLEAPYRDLLSEKFLFDWEGRLNRLVVRNIGFKPSDNDSTENKVVDYIVDIEWEGKSMKSGLLNFGEPAPQGTMIAFGSVIPSEAEPDQLRVTVDHYSDRLFSQQFERALFWGADPTRLDRVDLDSLSILSDMVLPILTKHIEKAIALPVPGLH